MLNYLNKKLNMGLSKEKCREFHGEEEVEEAVKAYSKKLDELITPTRQDEYTDAAEKWAEENRLIVYLSKASEEICAIWINERTMVSKYQLLFETPFIPLNRYYHSFINSTEEIESIYYGEIAKAKKEAAHRGKDLLIICEWEEDEYFLAYSFKDHGYLFVCDFRSYTEEFAVCTSDTPPLYEHNYYAYIPTTQFMDVVDLIPISEELLDRRKTMDFVVARPSLEKNTELIEHMKKTGLYDEPLYEEALMRVNWFRRFDTDKNLAEWLKLEERFLRLNRLAEAGAPFPIMTSDWRLLRKALDELKDAESR